MVPRSEPTVQSDQPFSDDLETWLEAPGTKTLGDLAEGVRSEELRDRVAAAPDHLGVAGANGRDHERVRADRDAPGLRDDLRATDHLAPPATPASELGPRPRQKANPFVARRVRWFERFARTRLPGVLEQRLVLSIIGAIVLLFTIGAFVAPPFSGLDTLPSLGVVVIALSLILEDEAHHDHRARDRGWLASRSRSRSDP